MSNDYIDRIQKIESDIEELKKTVRPGETPVYGIAMFIGLIIYIVVISNLPLPDDPGFWPRTGIGFACLIAGGMIFGGALAFIDFAFKAIVEVAAVLLLLFDVIYSSFIWMFSSNLRQWLIHNEIAKEEYAFGVVVIVAAIILFSLNMFAFLIIYPAAKTAGTKLELD